MGASLGGSSRSSSRRSGGRFKRSAEINVTPLVDVMLVLLIVFMVAAPLLTAGVSVDLPNSDAKAISDEDNKPIQITLTKDNAVFIGESEVEEKELLTKLIAMTEGQKDRRIYIRGDRALPYGKIMHILGNINAAGFSKVALISEAD